MEYKGGMTKANLRGDKVDLNRKVFEKEVKLKQVDEDGVEF